MPPLQPRRLAQRLEPAQLDELITGYRAGATAQALASRYGLSKTAVLGVLRARGVAVRRQLPSEGLIAEAARLYRSGLSLVQVQDQTGIPRSTLNRLLRARGVRLRDRHERTGS